MSHCSTEIVILNNNPAPNLGRLIWVRWRGFVQLLSCLNISPTGHPLVDLLATSCAVSVHGNLLCKFYHIPCTVGSSFGYLHPESSQNAVPKAGQYLSLHSIDIWFAMNTSGFCSRSNCAISCLIRLMIPMALRSH